MARRSVMRTIAEAPYAIGEDVYYKENGPADTGTIVDRELGERPGKPHSYLVEWDDTTAPDRRDWYTHGQLAK